MTSDDFLEIRDLHKDFSGVQVLKGIDLAFHRGEIHALLGENGAGKSTLIKILTGVYSASSGEIIVEGQPFHGHSPKAANDAGLGAVYQDAELAWNMSVAENLLLGNEKRWIDRRSMEREAKAILTRIGLDIDPAARAGSLTAAQMQMLTLATLFHRKFKLIVLDEPTARLSGVESELLFGLIRRFKAEGLTIVYISHRLNEVKLLCDRATILRDGKVVRTLKRSEIEEALVTQLMVNRSASDLVISNPGFAKDEIAIEVRGLTTAKLQATDLYVRRGEILGITGPIGGGMEQIEKALSGLVAYQGQISVEGRAMIFTNPSDALSAGIALIPEDRRKQALFPNLTMAENVSLPVLDRLLRFGLVLKSGVLRSGREIINQLAVHPAAPATKMRYFSGGNQQKAVIGKWLKRRQKVYIFSEPTSGVDVGAIRQIYEIMLQMAESGAAIILISTSFNELLSLSERIMVIHSGKVAVEASRSAFDRDSLLAATLASRTA
ncbi:sugar ABC transporter ATP-binding protein [Agrobacterium sp. NPDC090283]|uniref:sugar ABC transporter ATP-binding protein n=1 Tax=Agrobacterium sp. NPDC090283 TaxID=3363920 RepID=UPI00383A4E88